MKPLTSYGLAVGALLAIIVSCLASCATAAEAGPTAGPEGSWRLESLRGRSVPPGPEGVPTLRLAAGEASGTGACNDYGAAYELSAPDGIRFSEFWMTKMACDDLELETDYFSVLEEVRRWRVADARLSLHDGNGAELAVFVPLAPD